jgi:hypothetical protein
MAAPASRYGITTVDLNQAAQAVQVGDLGTFALTSPIAVAKIVEAEDQVEGHVRDRISVPLSPVPAPGETSEQIRVRGNVHGTVPPLSGSVPGPGPEAGRVGATQTREPVYASGAGPADAQAAWSVSHKELNRPVLEREDNDDGRI